MSSQFFENQPNEICSHLGEKASKVTFFKPEKLQNHSDEGEGKEEKKKKAMDALLDFIIATLEIVFGRKNCSTQKVHLAITLSKLRPARCTN